MVGIMVEWNLLVDRTTPSVIRVELPGRVRLLLLHIMVCMLLLLLLRGWHLVAHVSK